MQIAQPQSFQPTTPKREETVVTRGPETTSSAPPSPFGLDSVTLGGALGPSSGLQPLTPEQTFIQPRTAEQYLESREHNGRVMAGFQNHPFMGAERAQVALIDSFSFGHGQPQHGERVEAVLRREGGLAADEVLRIPNGSSVPNQLLTLPGNMTPSQRVDAFIEVNQADALDGTSTKLERILEHRPDSLTTINQSQGVSAVSVVEEMARTSLQLDNNGRPVRGEDGNRVLTPEGRVLFEGLGLEPVGTSENIDNFLRAAMERSHRVHEESPMIAAARERHAGLSRQVQEAGLNYVVAAGNDGDTQRFFRENLGVSVPETADDNLFSNPYNTTVGAFDNAGTASRADDRLAGFSTRGPQVDILASGVNVPTLDGQVDEGTSFAAPDVSAALNELAQRNPGLGPAQRRALLQQMNPPSVAGSELSVLR